jgi:hypothetical protein
VALVLAVEREPVVVPVLVAAVVELVLPVAAVLLAQCREPASPLAECLPSPSR